MRYALALALAAVCAAACNRDGGSQPKESEPPAPAAPAPRAAAETSEAPGLPWIHDDYAAALAQAKRAQKPLVIDMWAEWCHTCLAMKHEVFADPGLQPLVDRFVWLALDTDKPVNAPVLERLPVSVWPTFYVLSPGDESVQARFLGAASLEQFRELLAEGERGHLDALADGGTLPPGSPSALARAGDRAAVAGELAAAAKHYRAALDAAPTAWPRRPDVLVSLAKALYESEQYPACADAGLAHLDAAGNAASAGDLIYYAHACAEKLPARDERGAAIRTRGAARLEALVEDGDAPLSVDDRAWLMVILREIYEARGDADAARAIAERERALLDRAAAEAPTAYAASTHNWPRAEVYVYLGQGEKLVTALEASARALPDQYDPPYRLAWVLHRIGRHDEALAAAHAARELVYGPRAARVHELIADIHAARGDRDAELAARRDVVAVYEALAAGQKKPAAEQAARERLEQLAKRAPTSGP